MAIKKNQPGLTIFSCVLLFILLASFGAWAVSTSSTSKPINSARKKIRDKRDNVIGGFKGNQIAPGTKGSTISGGGQTGFPNRVNADQGSIGGGIGNQAGNLAAVGGGDSNDASGFRCTIGGGAFNTALIDSATVSGGYGNSAEGKYATIGGGISNSAMEWNSVVGGGAGNKALGRHSAIGGGTANTTKGFVTVISGGVYNVASEAYAAIGGGISNLAQGREAAIMGGGGNRARGDDAVIAGGLHNQVTDAYSTVGGGRSNIAGNDNEQEADAAYATVSGGNANQANGLYATVAGGDHNMAAGAYSLAAGRRAIINPAHAGSFLFADSNDFDFNSLAENEFAVRAIGGVRLVTAVDGSGNPNMTMRLTPGSGSWESYSDRNAKTNFDPIDGQEILRRVLQLPLTSWNYKSQSSAIKHIGPTAQDFHALFGIGPDDKHISSVDIDGVALAAIQGLYRMVQEKEALIKTQQQRLDALEAEIVRQKDQLALLEARFATMPKTLKTQMTSAQLFSTSLYDGWLIWGAISLPAIILFGKWKEKLDVRK